MKKTFLGEAWVAQLPAFYVPPTDLTDPSVKENGAYDWVWIPQTEFDLGSGRSQVEVASPFVKGREDTKSGAQIAAVKLKHLVKDHYHSQQSSASDSTRPDPDKEKGKHVLSDATIDFAARWVLDGNFKGRFYIKLFEINCRNSKLPPGSEVYVEVWEYGPAFFETHTFSE